MKTVIFLITLFYGTNTFAQQAEVISVIYKINSRRISDKTTLVEHLNNLIVYHKDHYVFENLVISIQAFNIPYEEKHDLWLARANNFMETLYSLFPDLKRNEIRIYFDPEPHKFRYSKLKEWQVEGLEFSLIPSNLVK